MADGANSRSLAGRGPAAAPGHFRGRRRAIPGLVARRRAARLHGGDRRRAADLRQESGIRGRPPRDVEWIRRHPAGLVAGRPRDRSGPGAAGRQAAAAGRRLRLVRRGRRLVHRSRIREGNAPDRERLQSLLLSRRKADRGRRRVGRAPPHLGRGERRFQPAAGHVGRLGGRRARAPALVAGRDADRLPEHRKDQVRRPCGRRLEQAARLGDQRPVSGRGPRVVPLRPVDPFLVVADGWAQHLAHAGPSRRDAFRSAPATDDGSRAGRRDRRREGRPEARLHDPEAERGPVEAAGLTADRRGGRRTGRSPRHDARGQPGRLVSRRRADRLQLGPRRRHEHLDLHGLGRFDAGADQGPRRRLPARVVAGRAAHRLLLGALGKRGHLVGRSRLGPAPAP